GGGADPAVPVVTGVTVDVSRCAAGVSATLRLGNAGGEAIPASTVIELVAITPAGEHVAARPSLGTALGAGRWIDVQLDGAAASPNQGSTWMMRVTGAGPSAPAVVALPETGIVDVYCVNEN